MILTYLTLLLLFVLPMGLSWYLEGISQDRSLSPRELASLTITSPFSAALSVPMHTSRMDTYTGQSLNVPDPILVPLWGGYGLPVWAIFLAIYPPISLFFLAIAYLAFRWRWWKAGDAG
jgi:hypothetical protein